MKGRQWYHREGDRETGSSRREAIVDRALLYAHLLAVIDQRQDEPEDRDVAVEQDSEEVDAEDEAETLEDPTGHLVIVSGMDGARPAGRL